MKSILILFHFLLFATPLMSQHLHYIDSAGNVMVEKMKSDLQLYERGSIEQDTYVIQIVNSLLQERQHYRYSTTAIHIDLTLQNLIAKRGDFQFLNPLPFRYDSSDTFDYSLYRPDDDTLSQQITSLEDNWERFHDSLSSIYDDIILIVENPTHHSRATKERAANILGRSHRTKDKIYIFENEKNLYFGIYDMECWGCERSGMSGLLYTGYDGNRPLAYWKNFHYFLEYWGDPEWAGQNSNNSLEFALFVNMTYLYKNTELLFEFILANAKDPNTKILKTLGEISHNKK